MNDLGYVIVTFNQASGQPKLVYEGDLYDNDVDAVRELATRFDYVVRDVL